MVQHAVQHVCQDQAPRVRLAVTHHKRVASWVLLGNAFDGLRELFGDEKREKKSELITDTHTHNVFDCFFFFLVVKNADKI